MRAPRIREPEQLGNLVERFAGRVVARAAEQAVASPRLDVEQQRVSAGDEQRRERRHGVGDASSAVAKRCPSMWCTPITGTPRANANALRVAHADEQRADEPGRVGHRDRVDVVRRRRRRARVRRPARSRSGARATRSRARRRRTCDARPATGSRASGCATSSPVPSSTAADVSSHDVSMPRMRITCAAPRARATGIGPTSMTFTCDGFTRTPCRTPSCRRRRGAAANRGR